MWTSCRICVTSYPNATASQPSIVHVGCSQPIRVYSLRCWASRERFFPVISRDATATKVYTHIVDSSSWSHSSTSLRDIEETNGIILAGRDSMRNPRICQCFNWRKRAAEWFRYLVHRGERDHAS
ncbi:hypothetical protein EDD15DRAFT_2518367 [Pisolithus albus]|nr:hypothetical protein EDD15DRAFT_2518367 [Pisolithus albus]